MIAAAGDGWMGQQQAADGHRRNGWREAEGMQENGGNCTHSRGGRGGEGGEGREGSRAGQSRSEKDGDLRRGTVMSDYVKA